MIVGFDVDGVIAKAPLGLHRLLGNSPRGWNILLKTPLGTLVYRRLRFVNKDIKELICDLHSEGHKIVIVTYALNDGQRKATEWLKKQGVPFDKIIAPKEKEDPLGFKIRAISEEGCDFYVEDQLSLVRGILKKVPGVHVIHYRNREDLNALKELS